jgi:hypothetical protein
VLVGEGVGGEVVAAEGGDQLAGDGLGGGGRGDAGALGEGEEAFGLLVDLGEGVAEGDPA